MKLAWPRKTQRTPLAAPPVHDDRLWTPLNSPPRHLEPTWAELREQMLDALHEWRNNPLAYRIIELYCDYVVGPGFTLHAEPEAVERFLQELWHHPQNRLDQRLRQWCAELARMGELFIVLNRNPADRMTYFREIPALAIDRIEADPDDLEHELRYHQTTQEVEGRWWIAADHPDAEQYDQVVVHYAINRPAGCARGMSDLTPLIRWLRRYSEWAEDRARLNRFRSTFIWHCKISHPLPGELERKRAAYARGVPGPGAILVTDDQEEWTALNPRLAAQEAASDGRAMRLLIAAGAGIPLHFLAEGESATRATAREMNQATIRHYQHRQQLFKGIVADLLRRCLRRAMGPISGEATIRLEAEDLSREEDVATAQAAKIAAEALILMRQQGWVEEERAARIALRFVGEP